MPAAPRVALLLLLAGACFDPKGAPLDTETSSGSGSATGTSTAEPTGTGGPATCGWVPIATRTRPPPRADHAMALDPGRGLVLLVGGGGGLDKPDLGDFYSFDGVDWQPGVPGGPGPRRALAMTYDSARDELVVFGGAAGVEPTVALGDTWIYQTAAQLWTRRDTTVTPSPRHNAAMAFHPGTGKSYLFGGRTDEGWNAETWTWDGATWALHPATGPTERARHGLVLHAATGELVLHGGCAADFCECDQPYVCLDDTWTFDGAAWTLADMGEPLGLASELAYEPTTAAVHRFGDGRTFRRDGDAWLDLEIPEPNEYDLYGVAPHPSGNGVVQFGGQAAFFSTSDETWWFRCDP